MASSVNNNTQIASGFSAPQIFVFPKPIVAKRNPNSTDKYQVGQSWINTTANSQYTLTSIVNNAAVWTNIAGGAGLFTSLTVNPGNLTVTAGNVIITAGTLTVGSTTQLNGTETITGGALYVQSISNAATAQAIGLQKSRAGGVITTGDALGIFEFDGYDGTAFSSGAQIIGVSTGTIAANRIPTNLQFWTKPDSGAPLTLRMTIGSDGTVTIPANDAATAALVANSARISVGDLTVTAGNVIVSGGQIQVSTGAVTGVSLYSTGDLGGFANETGITNVVNTAISTGTLSIKSTSANPGNNAGFLKIYIGVTTAYLPYFTNIAP